MEIKRRNREEYLTNLVNYANFLCNEVIPERENIEYLCGILQRTTEHFKDINDPCLQNNLINIGKAYDQLKAKLDSLN
jgi:hypothetical protein